MSLEFLDQEFSETAERLKSLDEDLEIDAILVLSGAFPDHVDEEIARINLALDVHQRLSSRCRIYLIGDSEQLGPLYLLTEGLDTTFKDRAEISLIDCGPSKLANTKTQFGSLIGKNWLDTVKRWNRVAIITSWYHVPRVARIATKYLPEDVNFIVLGAQWTHPKYSARELQEIETAKIHRYIESGDLARERRDRV